jgi:hypothetical protein
MKFAGHTDKCMYKNLVGELEGKTPLGGPRRRWEDNIKMILREIRLEGVGWIHVIQDRDYRQAVVNMLMIFRVP